MSLKIITNRQELNEIDVKFVDYNDMFFQSLALRDDEMTKTILQNIDNAEYASEDMIIGRDKKIGALNKSCLSTGCKTLLNIIYNPNVCFDVAECGRNALEMLSVIKDGMIFFGKILSYS